MSRVEASRRSRLASLLPTLRRRAAIITSVRCFFTERGFLEVETPLLLTEPAPEAYIDLFPCHGAFLAASPELEMKMLLAAGFPDLFQLTRSFRREERGRLHAEEFTILEWYRRDRDFRALMLDCEDLLATILQDLGLPERLELPGCPPQVLRPPFRRLTVEEAFLRFAGWSPLRHFDQDRFDHDLVELVEPELLTPTFLHSYPREAGSLAKLAADGSAERFEFYLGGVELANGFSELTDAAEQRQRFEAELGLRLSLHKEVGSLPLRYLELLQDLGPCAGIALGLDRLVLLLCGKHDLREVRATFE